MAKKRPASVLVLAILHLVGGGYGLLSALCTGGMLVVMMSRSAPAPAPGPARPLPFQELTVAQYRYMVEHVPHYQAGVIAGLVALLVLGILLVTAGVGLIYMRPWARTLSLVYAPLSILNRVGNFVYWIVLLAPAMKAFYQQMARSNSGLDPTILIADKFIYLSLILGLVVVVYPVVVLVVLLRPSVAAAFRDQAQDFQPPDDYDLGRAGPDGPPPSDAIPL